MKPSEFMNKYIHTCIGQTDDFCKDYGINISVNSAIDKQFIDREELREKIHNILMEHKSNDWSDFSYIWDMVDEEILKLLEE